MRNLTIALIVSALAACTTAPQPMSQSAEAEAHLGKLLAGKTAGAPISCLQSFRSGNMIVVDDNTVVFRDSARRVYRNDFRGGSCNNLGSGRYTLLTKSSGSGLCSGDIAQVVDLGSGISFGSCVLGDFVPYTNPRS